MKRELWTSALLGAVLLLGAPEARAAAGPLVAGPLFHFDGDTVTCQAVNTTTRAIENVLVRFRDNLGAIIAGGTCESLSPFAACGFTIDGIAGNGRVSCEITADRGTRGLRGTLQIVETGAASDAR